MRDAAPLAHYTAKAEKLTDAARIVAILKRLQQQRALLTVTLPESDRLYTSILVNVDADAGHFLLDELDPRAGHAQLLAAKKARVHARLRGVEVNFASQLKGVDTASDAALYTMSLPGLVNYYQRRAAYRARVGMEYPVPVLLKRQNGASLTGQLEDISAGGVGVRLDDAACDLAHGEILPDCRIALGPDHEISADIEVRSLNADALHLGARFLDLDKTQARMVERFVAALDRETRKREKAK